MAIDRHKCYTCRKGVQLGDPGWDDWFRGKIERHRLSVAQAGVWS